jgi:polyketide cyclase/dehydrase/lipid transport protein
MWTTEYTQSTAVSPEALWALLSDVNNWGSWNQGIETITMDGPLALGTTFRMKPPGEDTVTSTIAELQENRVLTDVTDMGELTIRVVHRLDPRADGNTAVIYRVEVTGPAAAAIGEEVGTAISADFPDVISALIAAAGSR